MCRQAVIESAVNVGRVGARFQLNFKESRLIVFPSIQLSDLVEVGKDKPFIKLRKSRLKDTRHHKLASASLHVLVDKPNAHIVNHAKKHLVGNGFGNQHLRGAFISLI